MQDDLDTSVGDDRRRFRRGEFTSQEPEAVHQFIRSCLAKHHVEVADTVRILYGGSVKPDNAKGLFAMPDIDGGLVGGASLDAKSFLEICRS